MFAEFYNEKRGPVNLDDPEVYHRLIEAEKFAYSYRTKLGDSNFVKDAQKISQNMTKTWVLFFSSSSYTRSSYASFYFISNSVNNHYFKSSIQFPIQFKIKSPNFRAFMHWIASRIPDVAQPLSYYNLDDTVVAEDHGTSHVVVLDREGNAVSTTSTVNQL